MNILLVDTATERATVALSTPDGYEEHIYEKGFSPSEDLLMEIKGMLGRKGIALKDLDLLVTTKGPGSFTGLRVALASLKGIRSASNAKLVSVPTLDVMIESAADCKKVVLAAIDARRGRYYLKAKKGEKVYVDVTDSALSDIASLLPQNEEIFVTGLVSEKVASDLRKMGFCADYDRDRMKAIGKSMMRLALRQLEEKGEDEIGEGPLYVRRSDAEEALLKKKEEKREGM